MFSKSCQYAIRAVLYIANHAQKDAKVGARELSEELDIPRQFLSKILQQLTRNGLMKSSKGPNGGFYLSKKNLNADLLSIIYCMDGKEVFKGCILGLDACDKNNPCGFHDQVAEYRKNMLQIIRQETIKSSSTKVKQNKYKC